MTFSNTEMTFATAFEINGNTFEYTMIWCIFFMDMLSQCLHLLVIMHFLKADK